MVPADARRTVALALLALGAFAANSLLCRAALAPRLIDPAGFTAVRLLAGAVVLGVIARATRAGVRGGSWGSAAALVGYAVGFSYAYVRIPAGVGALVLFGAVQLTMVGAGIRRGERPSVGEWAGLFAALAGLAVLTLPGARAPNATGLALMATAGVCWGVYSLRGRGANDPLAATADNFVRSVPFALALGILALRAWPPDPRGVGDALASGALASGGGYAVWYAVLRRLSATRAAIVQLAVPVLAAAGGVVWLGEAVTLRLAVAAAAILGGVALAVASPRRAR